MLGKRIFLILPFLLLTTVATGGVSADTLELLPEKDTTLYEDEAGRFGNGAGQYLFIGRTWDENGIDNLLRRALLKFDLSVVPAGSVINAASMSITIDRVPPDATGAVIGLHTVNTGWGEGASNAPGPEGQGASAQAGDATWLHTFFDTQTWSVAGGDFEPAAAASLSISSSPESVVFESSPDLVTEVQGWVDNPSGNHGWILLGDEQFGRNARRLLSRENAGPGNPTLNIEFTPPLPVARDVPALNATGAISMILALMLIGWRFFRGAN